MQLYWLTGRKKHKPLQQLYTAFAVSELCGYSSRVNKAERGSFAPETYRLATLDSPSLVNEDVREQQ